MQPRTLTGALVTVTVMVATAATVLVAALSRARLQACRWVKLCGTMH